MKSELRSSSEGCAEKSRLLIVDAARNLDTTSTTILLSTPNLSRNVHRWKQKVNIVPTTSKRRTGSEIPRAFQKLEDGRPMLQYDCGTDDPERMLNFAEEEVLGDFTTFGSWACDGTFKCSPLIFFLSKFHFAHCDIALHDTKSIRPPAE